MDVPGNGHHTITPRIVVGDVRAQVDFFRAVFDATGTIADGRPTELMIGDSLLMISSDDERAKFPAFLYIYVDNADAAYEKALAAGASVIEPPLDMPYGDRRAMITDPFGNILQIASRPAE